MATPIFKPLIVPNTTDTSLMQMRKKNNKWGGEMEMERILYFQLHIIRKMCFFTIEINVQGILLGVGRGGCLRQGWPSHETSWILCLRQQAGAGSKLEGGGLPPLSTCHLTSVLFCFLSCSESTQVDDGESLSPPTLLPLLSKALGGENAGNGNVPLPASSQLGNYKERCQSGW